MKATLKKSKARLFIIKKSKVLVLKKAGKDEGYSLPGGLVEKSETLKEGLIRETSEEIGMVFKKKEIVFLSKTKSMQDTTLYKYYFLSLNGRKPYEIMEPHKFETVVWISLKNANTFLSGDDKVIFEKHFSI